MKKFKKLICLADDFTGATDVASVLLEHSIQSQIIFNESQPINKDTNVLIYALKIRSVDSEDALQTIDRILNSVKDLDNTLIYYKFCSTFDSTSKGNIGPVMDYLLERFDQQYTILCPSMITNKRTVRDGILYVDNVLLADTSLRYHPLNPTLSSNIVHLMNVQSKYKSYVRNDGKDKHYYVIPDYEKEQDGFEIAKKHNLQVVGGGSSLVPYLYNLHVETLINKAKNISTQSGKTIMIAGSCSEQTLKQIDHYKKNNNLVYKLDLNRLQDPRYLDEVITLIKNHQAHNPLIYSSEKIQASNLELSQAIEIFYSQLVSTFNIKKHFTRVVVAGGETSGVVVQALEIRNATATQVIDKGVPLLKSDTIELVLKSGNFGSEDFFSKSTQF